MYVLYNNKRDDWSVDPTAEGEGKVMVDGYKTSERKLATYTSTSSEDSLQVLCTEKQENENAITIGGTDSLETFKNKTVYSDKPKNRWFKRKTSNHAPSPAPTFSIPRYSRPRKMDDLKGVVKSMISSVECVGLPIRKVQPPVRSPEPLVDLSCGRTNWVELYPELRLNMRYRTPSPGLPSSRTSSCIDFDEVVYDEVPRTPRTPPLPKIYGFDRWGRAISEDELTEIQYAFPDKREATNNTSVLGNFVSHFGNSNMQKRGESEIPKNPTNPKHERETAEDFMRSVCNEKIRKETEDEKVMKSLEFRIRRKMDVGSYSNESVDEARLTTLMRYVWKGKITKVEKYLQNIHKHRKINTPDIFGRTALHYASSWGSTKIVKELLKIPAIDINARDEEFKTPLYKAVEVGDFSTIKLLIKARTAISVKAIDGRDAFEYALQEHADDYYDIIKYLYEKCEMRRRRKHIGQMTYLHLLCLAKKSVKAVKTMQLLIDAGEFINATEGQGRTPLILAAQLNRVDVVKLLLKNSADPKHVDLNMKTAYHYTKNNTECQKVLIKYLQKLDKTGHFVKILDQKDCRNSFLTSPPSQLKKKHETKDYQYYYP